MRLTEKALSSPLFIQEREEPANLRQACHSHEESLFPAQSFFAHTSTARPVHEPSSSQKRKPDRDMENERISILLETPKEQILAEVTTEIQKHEFQADSDGRSIQDLTWITDTQRMEIDHAITSDEQSRRYQLLLQEQLSEQNRDLREALIKSLHEMEELKRFQGSTFDDSSRRRLIENQDIINELTARIQELQIEVNCMNDSRDFKDAESVRSGLSHVPSQPTLFPLYRDPGRLLSRNDKPPDIWNTQGISGNAFANPPASSSSPYPGGFNPWISNVTEDTSLHVTSERQIPDAALDPRFLSGPSARNSFDPKEGRSSKDYGADQQRLQISELHFNKFPIPTTFACWKIRFKTEVCTCSQFPTEAMLWIKEVEMVESVDDLKSSRSIKGTPGPVLWVARRENCVQHWTKSSRTPTSRRRVSLKEHERLTKKDRFLRGRQIAYLIYEYFRVTGIQWFRRELCRPIYYQLFEMTIFRNSIRKWDGDSCCRWRQILSDDILEGLYKLRVRESDKLKTVLELYKMEIHQKKGWTWLSQIDDNGDNEVSSRIWRMKNFEARNGNFETSAVVKNHRVQNSVNKEV